MKKNRLCFLLLLLAASAYAQADEPIPFASFTEITINTTFPQFRALTTDGGFVEVDGGIRGIIVYRVDANSFLAFERDCPYKPNSSCARVEVDMSRIFMIDRCCGSTFNFSDGYPTKGPASWPLRRYRAQVSGTTITITDEIVN